MLILTAGRSFLGQTPLFFVAAVLCSVSLPSIKPCRSPSEDEAKSSNLRKVDFLGSALLATSLVLLLLPLELGGTRIAWTDQQIPFYFGIAALSLALFVAAEKWWSINPLLPLNMFNNRHTVASFILMALQCAAQLGVRPILETLCLNHRLTGLKMMFTVPLYFQVTKKMSSSAAGSHLLPAVIGNAIGGIVAGSLIRK